MKFSPIKFCSFFLSAFLVFSIAYASPSTNTKKEKIDELVNTAFRDCLNENIKDNKMSFNKSEVDGRNWSIISVDCDGEKAKSLYEAVGPYSEEQYVRYSDGRRGIARFFGKLLPPSQCSRVTRNAKGIEMNLYSCSVRMDIIADMIREIKP